MHSLQARRTKQAYLYSPQGLAALRDVQEDSFGNLQRSAWHYTVQRVKELCKHRAAMCPPCLVQPAWMRRRQEFVVLRGTQVLHKQNREHLNSKVPSALGSRAD